MNRNKREKCYELFDRYNNVSKEFNTMASSINQLKSSVQNPDFIISEDFHIVAQNNANVLKNLEHKFNKCYGELLDLFQEVACIYGVDYRNYE